MWIFLYWFSVYALHTIGFNHFPWAEDPNGSDEAVACLVTVQQASSNMRVCD